MPLKGNEDTGWNLVPEEKEEKVSKGLRLVEHYASTQGEGPRTGELTQFVRFAGCNMTCPGWPCDTAFAVDPAIWRNNSYWRTPDDLVWDCLQKFTETGARNICLTGGEPFLQNNVQLEEFIRGLVSNGFKIECFSNGSFVYSDYVLKHVTFMMDWKLDGSGEGGTRLENRTTNALNLQKGSGIKFVIKDDNDLKQAVEVYKELDRNVNDGVDFWIGSAWSQIKEADLVEFIMKSKLPWKLNVQVHKYIWNPEERAV